jgi:hypothetical protein
MATNKKFKKVDQLIALLQSCICFVPAVLILKTCMGVTGSELQEEALGQ